MVLSVYMQHLQIRELFFQTGVIVNHGEHVRDAMVSDEVWLVERVETAYVDITRFGGRVGVGGIVREPRNPVHPAHAGEGGVAVEEVGHVRVGIYSTR